MKEWITHAGEANPGSCHCVQTTTCTGREINSWQGYFYFYPASQFSVKNYLFSKGVRMKFPDYLYLSKNYYDKSWSSKTHRRLKNVIVTMDFIPSRAAVREVAAAGKALSKTQEKMLKRAFSSADNNHSGTISFAELKEVLKAADVDVDGQEGDKFFSQMPEFANRPLCLSMI